MVEGDRDVADAAYDDLPVAHDRPLHDAVDAEDPDLGMVDERRHEEPTEPAGARDGEGPAAQLLGCERACPCRVCEPAHLGFELVDARRAAAANDGHDEAGVGLDGDPEVVALEVDDLVALEARVELREDLEALRHDVERERQEALRVEAGEIALLDERDGRDLTVRSGEVLDDLAANASYWLPSALGRPRGRAHVVLRDAPSRPGSP